MSHLGSALDKMAKMMTKAQIASAQVHKETPEPQMKSDSRALVTKEKKVQSKVAKAITLEETDDETKAKRKIRKREEQKRMEEVQEPKRKRDMKAEEKLAPKNKS